MSLKNNNSNEEVIEYFGDKRIGRHLFNAAKQVSLSNPNFRVKRAVAAGNNFLADVYRIIIEGTIDWKFEKIYVILKLAPSEPKRREIVRMRKVYLHEIYFYETILTMFDNVLRDYGMSVENFPTLYSASKEDGDEALVLEDLKQKGYVMRETKFLDYKHSRLTLRNLAKFHAYSFATRVKKPEIFESLKALEEPLFVVKHEVDNESRNRFLIFANIIRKTLVDEDDRYLKRFDHFIKNVSNILPEVVKGSNAEPYAVVNLGDVWSNNILFRYKENEENSEPQDLRFLDFQLCRYASPAVDISYALFCATRYEVWREHYDELLREYYDAFSKCLQKLDCDASVLFPYEVFLDHMERFSKYAAGMGIYVLHIFADRNNKLVEISSKVDEDYFNDKLQNDDYYRDTLQQTYKEFIDRNII